MSFDFPEIDKVGMETLDAMAQAPRLNKWMYDTIKPFCKGEILEIGSGTGNISQFFIDDNASITLSDIRENYCTMLEEKFAGITNVKGVLELDITADISKLEGQFDTIFALNVVEHIEDHELALKNMYKMLRPGGKVIILVPAYQALYNSFDKELEHFRRYNRKLLSRVVESGGFKVLKKFHFNFAGIFGWFVSGKLQRNEQIPGKQMKLYNKLVPLFKLIDRILFNQIGLSVVVVGEK